MSPSLFACEPSNLSFLFGRVSLGTVKMIRITLIELIFNVNTCCSILVDKCVAILVLWPCPLAIKLNVAPAPAGRPLAREFARQTRALTRYHLTIS